jgi:sugar phosphate isomerase/epimerase
MGQEGYKISDIYQGGYNSLDPNKGMYFSGAYSPASAVGTSTNPSIANQIGEINRVLNQGIVPVEMGSLSPQIFESIPKQHFKEIGRIAQLTGAKISLHAPIQEMEPSGITEHGWSEENRRVAERQLSEVVRKSFDLDERGGVPITVHSTSLGGPTYQMVNGEKVPQRLVAINQEDSKMISLDRQELYTPHGGLDKKQEFLPEDRLESVNRTEWENNLTAIHLQKKTINESIRDAVAVLAPIYSEGGRINEKTKITPDQEDALKKLGTVQLFLDDAASGFNSAFNKAATYSNRKEDKEILQKIVDEWKTYREDVEGGKIPDPYLATIAKSQLIDRSLYLLQQVEAPKVHVPIEDFSKEQSAKTFANAALVSYEMSKKTGKDPSKICIENMYPGMAFSDAKSLNALVDSSRKEFVNQAVKNNLMSKSEAEKKSEEIIGVTFDLGHLNIGKKYGFTDEDLIKEAKEISKNVKHVHIADNFGYADSHLPPGMGNVPNKEILEILEKEGFSGRRIVEAGGFINQFKESPFMYSLEGFGSPMYSSGSSPGWNTSYGLRQGYFSGYGRMLPQNNYNIFGAGFSSLPMEFGGNASEGTSRMGGNPLE